VAEQSKSGGFWNREKQTGRISESSWKTGLKSNPVSCAKIQKFL